MKPRLGSYERVSGVESALEMSVLTEFAALQRGDWGSCQLFAAHAAQRVGLDGA